MKKSLLMGNEAIAFGALRAGVRVVTGYPGTPSTEILETVAKNRGDSIYVEWSINEKAALEVAAGAAISGARAMVTMKQVGLNVASDPLMSLNYIGIKAGLVIAVADDPGPISSQTEQDTRHFGKFAKIAVFDPSSPEEAYEMIADAFDFSEKYGEPVILRPTTRICHSRASVELLPELPTDVPDGFKKDSRWVIFPRLSYANHIKIEQKLVNMAGDFSDYRYNSLTGSGTKGIVAGGISYAYVKDALAGVDAEYRLLKCATTPFPKRLGEEFLSGLDEALVIEELDPVYEEALISICGEKGLQVKIRGKRTGDIKNAGENTITEITRAVRAFLGLEPAPEMDAALPELPTRPPVLCAGCPHRASFFAVKEATKGRASVYSGDIGCYTLGNAPPLDMTDTCLCMGAGLTMAQGLARVEPDTLHFAFIGDSTFFHSGITGIINAVYNQTDIIAVILDNSTTAMTGSQPHPGTGRTMMGNMSRKADIYDIVRACGVDLVIRANPFDMASAKNAVKEAAVAKGVRVILFEAPCIALAAKDKPYTVADSCTGCMVCVKKLGCPALTMENRRAKVNAALCTGCGVCAGVCPAGALVRD